MKSSAFPIRVFFPSLVLALSASLAGFEIAYQQDASQIADSGRLAWLHLAYAQELKDDMAIIDWSKNLEKLGTVRVFQATSNSKTIVQGGNANYLPSAVPDGVAYLFPSDWSYQETSPKSASNSLEFTAVFHSWPGPFLWGCFCFLVSFVSSCGLSFLSRLTATSSAKTGSGPAKEQAPVHLTSSVTVKLPAKPTVIPFGKNDARLLIDNSYIIRQVTPEAASLLHKTVEELREGHFLELNPMPALTQAFEKKDETKILKAFSGCPEIDVQLKPDSEGCVLILESVPAPKPL